MEKTHASGIIQTMLVARELKSTQKNSEWYRLKPYSMLAIVAATKNTMKLFIFILIFY
jgi:hypothetical protein